MKETNRKEYNDGKGEQEGRKIQRQTEGKERNKWEEMVEKATNETGKEKKGMNGNGKEWMITETDEEQKEMEEKAMKEKKQ